MSVNKSKEQRRAEDKRSKQLKSFFNIDDYDTSKTYVFQDTLSEILMYRA